jgi:hypothetical protein
MTAAKYAVLALLAGLTRTARTSGSRGPLFVASREPWRAATTMWLRVSPVRQRPTRDPGHALIRSARRNGFIRRPGTLDGAARRGRVARNHLHPVRTSHLGYGDPTVNGTRRPGQRRSR